jgi:hypothetical protein
VDLQIVGLKRKAKFLECVCYLVCRLSEDSVPIIEVNTGTANQAHSVAS